MFSVGHMKMCHMKMFNECDMNKFKIGPIKIGLGHRKMFQEGQMFMGVISQATCR